jgi:hypothetical protein
VKLSAISGVTFNVAGSIMNNGSKICVAIREEYKSAASVGKSDGIFSEDMNLNSPPYFFPPLVSRSCVFSLSPEHEFKRASGRTKRMSNNRRIVPCLMGKQK